MTVDPTPHVRRAGFVITLASLGTIGLATLLPDYGHVSLPHLCLFCGALGGVNALLNLFLFAPLGVGLALAGVPKKRSFLAMFVLSVLIETAQLKLIPGRDAAIGDVVANTLGGALGFLIAWHGPRWLWPQPRFARKLGFGWSAFWLAIQIVSSFALAVSLPDPPYYGQIAGDFWNFALFPGRALAARIGDVAIPDTALSDSHAVRRLLLDGATAVATVLPAEPTSDVAPILRVVDRKKEEIVLLAQSGNSLVFTTRTGAGVLKLRPLLFGLADGFPSRSPRRAMPPDTLWLSGRYTPHYVRLTASTHARSHDRSIAVTASLGWALWLPFQWFVEGTRAEMVIGWVWLIALAIPLGYWLIANYAFQSSRGAASSRLLPALTLTALLCAGFVAVPLGFGVALGSLSDWMATAAGILIGSRLGALIETRGAASRARTSAKEVS